MNPPSESILPQMAHVLYCASSCHFQHVGVSAASLLSNNPGTHFAVHLITCDPVSDQDGRLEATLAAFPNGALHLYRADEGLVGNLFVDWRVTKECYLRLVAPSILPDQIDRVLYLDSDVVVLNDLTSLLRADLGPAVIGAIPDLIRFVLGPDSGGNYVNSGVLLIDMGRWRREDLTTKTMAYARAHSTYLEYHDQDVINHVLRDQIALLDFRWNIHADILRFPRRLLGPCFARIDAARRNVGILHYAGERKPWLFRSQAAAKREYFRYLDRTEWRGACPPGLSRPKRLEHRLDRALVSVGIDRQRLLWIAHVAPKRLWGRATGALRRHRPTAH